MAEISDHETSTLFAMMDEPFTGETYLQDGWVYRDPRKMKTALWERFLNIIGVGNYRLMSLANYSYPDGNYKRGQLLISPTGMENLREWTKQEDRADG